MPLITQIQDAVDIGELRQPFTVYDLKEWMKKNLILKDDGEEYAESSINAILSNSDVENKPTSNKNIKVLDSRKNNDGVKEYWFND